MLNKELPLSSREYGHLKRLRNDRATDTVDAILSPCLIHSAEQLSEFLSKHGIKYQSLCEKQVSRWKPHTAQQFADWTLRWPLSFSGGNEEKRDALSESDLRIAARHMQTVFAMLADDESAAAVIVDPATDSQVASGLDRRKTEHPLLHATIQCINQVAEIELTKRRCMTAEEDGYLCTGLDLYVSREPCVMCSMALVHSRIRRVIYASRNSLDGGLGSCFTIHLYKSLNHHYRVYRDMNLQ